MTVRIQHLSSVLGALASTRDSTVMSAFSLSSLTYTLIYKRRHRRDTCRWKVASSHYRSMTFYLGSPVDLGCFLPFWEASTEEHLGNISHHKTCIYMSFKNPCITFSYKITGLVVWNICLQDTIILWPKVRVSLNQQAPTAPTNELLSTFCFCPSSSCKYSWQ